MALILKRAGHLRLRLDSHGLTADDVVTLTLFPVGGDPVTLGLTDEEARVLGGALTHARRL